MVSGRHNLKASGRSSLRRTSSSESTHTTSRSTTSNSKPKHEFYVHVQDNEWDEDSEEENATQPSKLQIESPGMSRSSKKKEWMKKRANAARAAISPLTSTQNTADVAEIYRPPSEIARASPSRDGDQDTDTDTNIDECYSPASPNNVFTFSPTSSKGFDSDSKENPNDDYISFDNLDLHPSDETTTILLNSSRDLSVASEESMHNLFPRASGMTTSNFVSLSCDTIKNQNKYQALTSMSTSVEIISAEEASMKEEDRNGILTDRGDEEEYSFRDNFNSPTITLRGSTNRSSTKLYRPMPSCASTTGQTQIPYKHNHRSMEETAVATMGKSTSTCTEEARLHVLLEKVSKSSDERIMQTNWWDEESKAPSAFSPRIKIHNEEADVFATMANVVSQLLENAGCNLSLCTESDDLVGDEIDIAIGHQSMVEDDITFDLNTSLMNA